MRRLARRGTSMRPAAATPTRAPKWPRQPGSGGWEEAAPKRLGLVADRKPFAAMDRTQLARTDTRQLGRLSRSLHPIGLGVTAEQLRLKLRIGCSWPGPP